MAALAVAGALWFDLKITPNALDLRLTDREFVRKIYECEVFEADTPKQYRQIYFVVNVLFVAFVMFSIFGQIFVDYKTKIKIDYEFLNYFLYCIVALYICFNTRYYPITKILQYKTYKDEKITLGKWAEHGYHRSRVFVDHPFIIMLFIIFFVILCGFIGVITFSSINDATITDAIAFVYVNAFSAMGFSVPAIMNIHTKGQRVAQNILKK